MRRFVATLAAASAVLYFVGLAVDSPLLRLVVKPLPALCLALLTSSRTLAFGLVLSSLGDGLLEAGFFLGGVAAFLATHLAYLGEFLSRSRVGAWGVALVVLALGALNDLLLFPSLGALKVPIVLYTAALGMMLWRGLALWPLPQGGRRTAVGAALFALSDTLLAWDRFHGRIAGAGVTVMVLYWAGQALVASGGARRVARD